MIFGVMIAGWGRHGDAVSGRERVEAIPSAPDRVERGRRIGVYADKPLLHARQKARGAPVCGPSRWTVTSHCNMTCSHCYAETFNRVEMVDLDTLGRALDEFHELGVSHYVLQGGEPITTPSRLEYILRRCHPDETYINVVTNGWAMDRDAIRRLKDLKVDKIAFSLDSGIEAEHDANRLPGSFKRVLAGIDAVMEEGLLTSISVVVTHASLRGGGCRGRVGPREAKRYPN